MDTKDSINSASTLAVQSQQPAPVDEAGQKGPGIVFFATGIFLNIIIIAAFVVWAYRQWKKPGG